MSKTLEPQADYAIHVEAATAAPTTPNSSPAAPTRKDAIAEVAYIDEKGDKFDAHGIRIGRWESEPCGNDFINGTVSLLFPCVSAAQISHRLGGSYLLVLLFWGVVYSVSVTASIEVSLAYRQAQVEYYTTYYGRTYASTSASEDELLLKRIVWNVVSSAVGITWLILNVYLRSTVRGRWSIPGSCCGDCCCAWWCSCCALSQMAAHIKSYQPNSCNLGPCVDALPAYTEDETTAKP